MARWLIMVMAGVVGCGLIAGPAMADQRDARLPTLFSLLREAPGPAEAAVIEQQIVRIWSGSASATADLFLQHGAAAEQDRNLALAEQSYTAAIDAAPDFAEAWNRRATVRFLKDDLDGALDDVERTLALEPRHFGALAGLGQIRERQNRPDLAVAAYRQALDLHPQQSGLQERLRRARTLDERSGT
ncbi:MAG: hypothetical protein EAZ99_10665 [Alphaproteobacteria bacterium]|nr:MAG: hypothetical protein EAZ99_10665 [Alphaproteobacteria bacterium]